MGRQPKRPTKATSKTDTAPAVNKTAIRLVVAVLFVLWMATVFAAGWGDYRVQMLRYDISIWNLTDCQFAEAVHIIGVIISTAILLVILILLFRYLKAKVLPWIILAIPILAFTVTDPNPPEVNAGLPAPDSLAHCIATAATVDVGLILMPFFLLAGAIIRVGENMWHLVFGKRN